MATTTTTPTTNRSEYIGRVCRSWLDKKGKILDKHIRAPPVDGKVVRYWLEHSSDIRPASCCLCDLHISHPEGEYRIIVLPRPPRQERNDYWHVRCFERIADLGRYEHLVRITPLTRFNWGPEGRNFSSYRDRYREYMCAEGVRRLLLEWQHQRTQLIHASHRTPGFVQFLDIAGMHADVDAVSPAPAPAPKGGGLPIGAKTEISFADSAEAIVRLPAPRTLMNKFKEPDLFAEPCLMDREPCRSIINTDPTDLQDRHSLSTMLNKWLRYERLASDDPSPPFTSEEKMERIGLGKVVLRRIARLSRPAFEHIEDDEEFV